VAVLAVRWGVLTNKKNLLETLINKRPFPAKRLAKSTG
jgi:hypothetical protein